MALIHNPTPQPPNSGGGPPQPPNSSGGPARAYAKAVRYALSCVGIQLTLLAAVVLLKEYDLLSIIGMAVGALTGILALMALGTPKPWEWGHAPYWAVAFVLGSLLMSYSGWQTKENSGSTEKRALVTDGAGSSAGDQGTSELIPAAGGSATGPPPAGVKLGTPVDAGTDPVAMARVGDFIWVLEENSVLAFDSRLKRRASFSTLLPQDAYSGPPFDIAARGTTVAVVNGGWLSLYGLPSGESLGGSVNFSQSEGHVEVTETRVWVCDYDTSKVDRLELAGYGDPVEVGVPGRPTAIIEANGLLYVASTGKVTGSVSVVDPRMDLREAALSVDIDREPRELVYAFGEIWALHSEERRVTRIDVTPGEERIIDEDIRVDASVAAMAFAGDSVFTISSSHDRLQRRNRQGRLIGEEVLPFQPTDMIEAHGRLYVLSKADNAIMEIEVTPASQLRDGPFVR